MLVKSFNIFLLFMVADLCHLVFSCLRPETRAATVVVLAAAAAAKTVRIPFLIYVACLFMTHLFVIL